MESLYSNGINDSVFNIKAIFKIPKSILFTIITILSFSVICLYSSSNGDFFSWPIKQIFFISFSTIIFISIISVNTKYIYSASHIFYFFSILSLIIVLLFGKRALGASRWIDFGFITIQPSEFAKIAVVLSLSHYFSRINGKNISRISSIFLSFMIILPIIILIAIQPDLATSIIVLGIYAVILLCIGTPKKYFIFATITLLLSLPIIWFKFLKKYQQLRVINFIFPENDPLGSGYNVIQSKIAIGSGNLFGKGFMQGTQGKLRFLPEHHTDFIFTIVGEEFGFAGCCFLILLYSYILYYGFKLSTKINSTFYKLVCIGCCSIIFFHLFINIGMTVGILPVAGIPLIMFSYGGSNVLLGMICLAIMINIDINKQSLN